MSVPFIIKFNPARGGFVDFNANVRLPISTTIFTYTGADQSITIPYNATYATIQCWGAGGGSGVYWNYSNCGGGGGYTSGTFDVTNYKNTSLKIIVGQAGAKASGNTYGGGGGNGGGSGGGRSAAQLNIAGTYTEIITAGGGGCGGSSISSGSYGAGGAGGGTTGGSSYSVSGEGATGGTQSAGGTGGAGDANGANGSKFQGGSSGYAGQGGGGGGWYGGGSGALKYSVGGGTMAGGGGGSSYINTTYGTLNSMLQGNDWTVTTSGNKVLVANDTSLPSGYTGGQYGYGAPAISNTGGSGGNGIVVVTFIT